MNTFAEWRADLGVPQSEAAALLGMTQRHVSNLERGLRVPLVDTRRLMSLIARGSGPSPGLSKRKPPSSLYGASFRRLRSQQDA
jgi:transcriptional regulator with XRE-family HTH domain